MLAVTGKSVSELFAEITAQYGNPCWAEADFRMTPERKAELQKLLFTEKEGAGIRHGCRSHQS